ncbi:hypothetical protein [Bacillus thermotolerans]|uniref:Uncharacterized protein n=1 Tax=Bacillus thermotolerans TaxID=1221996 RepID=A0A0F5HK26_BACTR|nr:hypothetical protein [Bacillus thermotolerans]KKB33593.1 hypothetical protein QY97_03160 [Bacillus thermotolerans]KKB41759.1 hypothetical protein QY95_00566 [Bacillus thermotolerans]KKB44349.1 hypothetical protein QY96_02949 [Bacillus thermotolerans]
MLKKLIQSLLNQKQKKSYRKYSSSDHRYHKRSHHPSKYGHHYYKRKGRSSSFYSS